MEGVKIPEVEPVRRARYYVNVSLLVNDMLVGVIIFAQFSVVFDWSVVLQWNLICQEISGSGSSMDAPVLRS